MKTKNLTLDPGIGMMLRSAEANENRLVQEYMDHPEKLPLFMDFKVDFAFKYILGHKPILLKLINDVLPVEVSDIEYLPNEVPVLSPKEKRAVFDVFCTEKHTGQRFVVEMQCVPDMDMDNRLLYYGSAVVQRQVERGAERYLLNPVYVLCIANYERPHVKDVPPGKIFFGYQLREQTFHNDVFTDKLQFFFLELPRLGKVWDSLETNMERWCYLFGNLNNFAEVPDNKAGFGDVFVIARTGSLDPEERRLYISSMLNEYEKYTISEYARQEGVKEGVRQGIKEGIQLVAKKLLTEQVPVSVISSATGLSAEEILSL